MAFYSIASDFAALSGSPEFLSAMALRMDVFTAVTDPAPFLLNGVNSGVCGGLFLHTAAGPFTKNNGDSTASSARWAFNVVQPLVGNTPTAFPASSLDGAGDLVLQPFNNFGGFPVDSRQQFPVLPAAFLAGAGAASSELFQPFRWNRLGVALSATAAPFQQFVVNGTNLAGVGIANVVNLLACYSGVTFLLDPVGVLAGTQWQFVLPPVTGSAGVQYEFVVATNDGSAPPAGVTVRIRNGGGASEGNLFGTTQMLVPGYTGVPIATPPNFVAGYPTGACQQLLPGVDAVTIGGAGALALVNGDRIRVKAVACAVAGALGSAWHVEIVSSHSTARQDNVTDGYVVFA